MSAQRTLSAAFWDYDRTLPLYDGRIGIEGVDLRCQILRPQELFPRAFGQAEFDVSELSLSRYLSSCASGCCPYLAIPVFPSRSFRHASIYVRTDRGIARPQDLAGRTLGLNNYDDTAAVVARGMLRDDYGLGISDITWCIGDMEAGQVPRVAPPALPERIKTSAAPAGTTLDDLLAQGTIDGVISITPPPSFRGAHPRIARLFADWRSAERDWFSRTGLFPIMHLVGIRRTLVESDPGLARVLYDAFCQAKNLAVAELENFQAPKVTLPWAAAELEQSRALLGRDFWPYGLAANRRVIAAQIRYSMEDGLLAGPLDAEGLFDPGLRDT